MILATACANSTVSFWDNLSLAGGIAISCGFVAAGAIACTFLYLLLR